MGANSQQELSTLFARIVAGALSYLQSGLPLSFQRMSAGVYRFTLRSALSALEQFPTLTVCGTDPTADAQIEIVGGGPSFSVFNVLTYVGGNPADVDVYVAMERVRTENIG